MASAPRLRVFASAAAANEAKATPIGDYAIGPEEAPSQGERRARNTTALWLLAALVLVLLCGGALIWLQWGWCYRGYYGFGYRDGYGYGYGYDYCRDRDGPNANLVLQDSQRLVLTSLDAIPQVGTEDIILIVVQNVDDHNVVDIGVTLEVTSAARKRSAVSLPVVCPPLYTSNEVAYLASKTSMTCRATYALVQDDIVNGNTIYTQSMATGIIDGTDMTTMAEPGMSRLSLNNIDIPQGAIFSVPGPTTPPDGTVNVVSGSRSQSKSWSGSR